MIQSVQRALQLLSALGDSHDAPMTLTALSRKTGIHISTCAHLVKTLEEEGYALRISHAKGYVLGPAAYYLSRYGRYRNDLVSVCRPIMQYLHKNLGRDVILTVIEGGAKYVIDYAGEGTSFRTEEQIRTDHVYRSATGRAILLNLPADRMYGLYQKLGPPSEEDWPEVRSFEDLKRQASKRQIEEIFQVCHTNPESGILELGYGAAIFGKQGCAGAIGVSAGIPPERFRDFTDEEKRICRLLVRSGKEISRRLAMEEP